MLYLSGNKKSLYLFFLIPPMPDKTARLLEYLAALTKLGSKAFYSLDDYERVFWLHSLPCESPLCFCRAWKAEEQGDDLWLTVKKAPPRAAVPQPPDDCVFWLRQDVLANCKETPELEPSVILDCAKDNAEKTLHLNDFPAVQEQWQSYLEEQRLSLGDNRCRPAGSGQCFVTHRPPSMQPAYSNLSGS
jgi:hypothetical protein